MSSALDRYLDHFGENLAGAEPPRRRRTPVLGVVAVVACVAAVLFGLGLTDSPAGRALDAVAEARAALTPPGEVVHLKITARTTGEGINVGVQPRGPNTTEQWTAVEPPRWRVVQTSRTPVGGLTDRTQFSYAGGAQSFYSERRNELTRSEGYSDQGPAAEPVAPLGGDPENDLRSLLASGRVRDTGLVQTRGRQVRRLTSERDSAIETTTFAYDVDPSSFAPVAGTLTVRFHRKRGNGTTDRYTLRTTFIVNRYERLPLNSATEKLLVIPTKPDTDITVVTKADRERLQRRFQKGCRRVKNNPTVRACPATRG